MYADDTTLVIKGNNLDQMSLSMGNNLGNLAVWCRRNKIKMNTGKTNSMLFGTHQAIKKANKPDILIDGTKIDYVPSYKYLGIKLDPILNFKIHLSSNLRSARHKLYMLKRMRHLLTDEHSLIVYKAMVLPYLEYGNVLHMHGNKSLNNALQKLQNYGLKMCLRLRKREPTISVHRKARLNTLMDRAHYQLLRIMYRRSDDPKYTDNRQIQTRQHTGICLARKGYTSAIAQRSSQYYGSREFNRQTIEVRSLKPYSRFSYALKKSMIDLLKP